MKRYRYSVNVDNTSILKETKIDPGKQKTSTACEFSAVDKKMISVISNKGGAGKTSIACCLAIYLAEEIQKKTLLLELDCSPGDFGTLFDISRDLSLEMAIRFSKDYRKYIKSIKTNLDVLKGLADPVIAENINNEEVKDFINIIVCDYDYIIVDTQTVLNGILVDFLMASDQLLTISDPSSESIARISSFLELLNRRFNIDKDLFKLIINKKKPVKILNTWVISRILDLPIDALISLDKRFNKSDVFLNSRRTSRTRFYRQVRKAFNSMNPEICNAKG
jgi:MinD-like ATPase involved in chromosome partitioning or flagellar assembly